MNKFRDKFIISAKWLSFVNILRSILQILAGILLARLITPDSFGQFAFFLALIESITVITGFGINTSILQNKMYPEVEFRNTGFFLTVILIFIYFVVAILVGIIFVDEYLYDYQLMLFGKTIFMVSGVHSLILQKTFQFKTFSLIQFVSFLVSSSIAIVLALVGYDLETLVIQYAIMQVLLATLTVIFSPFKVDSKHFFCKDYMVVFANNGRELFTSQLVEKWIGTIDKLIINGWLGAASLAYYNRAIGTTRNFQSIVLSILQPLLVVSFADLQDDKRRLGEVFNTSIWIIIRISLLIVLIFVCAADEIVLILFGENWLFTAKLIPLVAIFVLFSPVRLLSRSFLLSTGYFKDVKNIQLMELLSMGALLVAGGYSGGIEGVSIAISGWMLIITSIYGTTIKRIIDLRTIHLFLLPIVLLFVIPLLVTGLKYHLLSGYANIYIVALISIVTVIVISGFSFLFFEYQDVKSVILRFRA